MEYLWKNAQEKLVTAFASRKRTEQLEIKGGMETYFSLNILLYHLKSLFWTWIIFEH